MNKSEKKSRLERISRELYPNVRRNAKTNVRAMELLLRYIKLIEVKSYGSNKLSNILNRVINSKLDYKYYKKRLNKYNEELSFKNPNVTIGLIFTQMIAEDSCLDIVNMISSVRNIHMRSKLIKYTLCNCPSIESVQSTFSSFKRAAIDDMDGRERDSLSARSVLGRLDSFIFMDDIRNYSESTDIDEVKFSKYGKVYVKMISYVYLGENKYTVNMDVNLHSRYINDAMGLRICKELSKLTDNLSKNDMINQDIEEIRLKLDSIISGSRELDSNDTICISSIQTSNPYSLLSMVSEFKNIMKCIKSINFKSEFASDEGLDKLLKALKDESTKD